jgi:translocation and assembly module TamB
VTEGFVVDEDSSGKAYGGVVTGQMAKDLRMSDWGGRIDVKSTDLSAFLKDMMPDVEGNIAGSADLRFSVNGDTKRTSMQTGEGSLEVKNGEITGFKGTEAVSKLIGGRPLRFSSLLASFTIDGKTIYLLPGSRVSAPKGDPVFNYIMADGSITMEKDINILCVGNVNIRALNSLVGGMHGLISSAMEDGTAGLTIENFLGGAIKGFSKNEFRDVSLAVRATSQDILSIEDLRIANPPKSDLSPELNEAERRREKNDERIRLNLEFPVGPGGERNKRSLGGDVGGQVLEQALTGLLSF